MSISFRLDDKLILVTGASSGIGQSIAIEAAQAGARVLLCGRNEGRLAETADQCKDRGILCPQDLSDLDALPKFVRNLAKEHGLLSGLVHSAGIEKIVPLRAVTTKHLREIMDVNTLAAVMLAKGFVGRACTSASSIVLISSVAGHVGQTGHVGYCMSKAALNMAAMALGPELQKDGVRVNTISPAMIDTPIYRENFLEVLSKAEQDNIMNKHPSGVGDPEDVAAAAIYLLSDASKFVTGTSLLVDGGYCAQ